jgi:cobalt/nickel transport system permease protein
VRPLGFVVGGLVVALMLVFVVAPYASDEPDGLNKVARDKGFSRTERTHPLEDSPVASYSLKGVGGRLSTGYAGAIGILACFGLAFVSMRVIRRRGARVPRKERAPT